MLDEVGQIHRVLLVDSDVDALGRIASVLKEEGLEVSVSSDVSDAIEQARAQSFGVAILAAPTDPDSGLDLLSDLQRVDDAIQIIVYTAASTTDTGNAAVHRGAYASLEKDSDTSELVRTVHSAFRSRLSRFAQDLQVLVDERTRSLRASEERIRDIVETATDWIWETDAFGRYTYIGPRITELLGYAPEELIGRFILDIVPEDSRPAVHRSIAVVRRTKPHVRSVEAPIAHKGGSTVLHEMRWVPRLDADGEVCGYRGIGCDITDARQLEVRLRQAQKLDVVGRLAGGIAHDFNNLLTVILGNSEFLLEPKCPPDDVRELARSTLEAAQRGSHLTRQLLSFARQRPMASRIFDLATSLTELQDMLVRLIGGHFPISISTPDAALWIRADPGQIEQILVNLAVNARDAMPNGGHLSIEASLAPASARLSDSTFTNAVEPLDCVALRVTDTGEGMPPDVLDKIFEPFYTTKGSTGGVGLGLASVYGIVRQAEGDILVESQVGEGTTFEIFFPLAPAPRQASPQEGSSDSPPSEFTVGTILLVDGEPNVRQIAERALTSSGFSVIACGSGREAIRRFATRHEQIDLLVTDLVMPGMMGHELARQLRERVPDLKVLFVSDYRQDEQKSEESADRDAFLEKPFTATSLRAAVRGMLTP